MSPALRPPACHELVLGGQRSGKSARAEALAARWLAADPAHRAVLVATAQPWDEEMRQRIARHQADRAARVPGMSTIEEPRALEAIVRAQDSARTMLVIDCLTLWLTNLLMPARPEEALSPEAAASACEALALAVDRCPGPVVMVSNEIGWGVIPMGREVRAFVDAQGRMNQRLAQACERVTLMSAGLPLVLKGAA